MSCRDGRLSCVVAVWLPSGLSGEALGRISELLRGVVGVGKRRLDSAILFEYDLSSVTCHIKPRRRRLLVLPRWAADTGA